MRQAVARFEEEDDEGRQEEFRQLLKSYIRFYSFIAQVVSLDDTGLEKLYYLRRLARLGCCRTGRCRRRSRSPTTCCAFRLSACRSSSRVSASLSPGDRSSSSPSGVRRQALHGGRAEVALRDHQGLQRTPRHAVHARADFIRFEQVNQDILDDDMTEMLRNNPPDVVYNAFFEAFFSATIRAFQRDHEMRSIILSDAQARNQAIRHFFNRARRIVREGA